MTPSNLRSDIVRLTRQLLPLFSHGKLSSLCEEAWEGLLGASCSPHPPSEQVSVAITACLPQDDGGGSLIASSRSLVLHPRTTPETPAPSPFDLDNRALDLKFEPAALMGRNGGGLGNTMKRKGSKLLGDQGGHAPLLVLLWGGGIYLSSLESGLAGGWF